VKRRQPNKRSRRSFGLHAVSAAAAAAAAFVVSSAASARPLQDVLNSGTLRVGVAVYAPWALRSENGDLRGFEVDVANKLAADMGVEPQIVAYAWKQLLPALESGEIDVIAAGMTITPERALRVNFSQPYESGGIALAANSSSTSEATTLEDLNSAHYRLGAVKDSVAASLVQRVLPNAKLVTFKDSEAATQALVEGKVDGYLEEQPVPEFLALEHPGKIDVPLGRPLLETRSGFAVGKGDPDFLAFLDAWITAHEADTWLPSTYHYWFETLGWRDAGDTADKR
jgi:polar amino acid transport system substrate-binding protein